MPTPLLMSLLREIITPEDYYKQGDNLMGDIVKLEQALTQRFPDIQKVDLSARSEKSVHINSIRVKKSGQGKGIGSEIINSVKEFATKNNLPITLTPEPDKGKKEALVRFYKKHGFVKCRDPHYTNPFGPTLIWFPKNFNSSD